MDGTNLTITGRVARDPKPPRAVGDGKVTTMVLAVHRTEKVNGQQERVTDFWEYDVWGDTADLAAQKTKGALSVVSGTFDGHRTWESNGKSGLVYKIRPHRTPSAIMFFDLVPSANGDTPQNAQRPSGNGQANRSNSNSNGRATQNGAQRPNNSGGNGQRSQPQPQAQRTPATAESGGFDWDGLDGGDEIPFQ